jgi:beta-lactamase superfamily II metal-dependent hydrolase
MEVIFLDVGHGCCTIIVTPTKRSVIMVDCKFGAGPTALAYLRRNDLGDPTAFYISHLHEDHVAGFADIFSKLIEKKAKVDRVYSNCVGRTTRKGTRVGGQAVVDQMRDLLDDDQKRLPLFCSAEPPWSWDKITFSILHPDKFDLHKHQDREEMLNELSGVVRIEFGRASVLLPGDVQGRAVSQLIRRNPEGLRSSLLLFPHHGAAWEGCDSAGRRVVVMGEEVVSPDVLVQAVAPTWTVLSVGTDNDGHWDQWQHPSPGTLANLRRWHGTDEDGSKGFVCTEATAHCQTPILCSPVRCGGNLRFRLYENGCVELADPKYESWQEVVSSLATPQCKEPQIGLRRNIRNIDLAP